MSTAFGLALSKGAGSVAVKAAIVATAALGGTAIVASSVFASLTASATGTTSATTGTLRLTQDPSVVAGITGGFQTAISGMAPGDTINRYVTLTNGGTLDAVTPTLGLQGTTTLVTDGTKGLQIAVSNCTVAWTSLGVCSGTSTSVMASTSALAMATPRPLNLVSNNAGSVSNLRISITMPDANENVVNGALPVGTVQGLSTTLTWTFSQAQRTGLTTNN